MKMKNDEVIVGQSYLFSKTDVEHRKNMEGTIVTVTNRIRKKGKAQNHSGIIHKSGYNIKFRLSNGQYANAANLKSINQ